MSRRYERPVHDGRHIGDEPVRVRDGLDDAIDELADALGMERLTERKLHKIVLHRNLRVVPPGPNDDVTVHEPTGRMTLEFEFTPGHGEDLVATSRRMAEAAGWGDFFALPIVREEPGKETDA